VNKYLNLLLFFFFIGIFSNISFGQTDPTAPLPQFNKKDLKNSPSLQKGNTVTCGTSPNQFTIQIVSDSSYNGFDLKCADGCSGFYTVNVTGGLGPFTFEWTGAGDASTETFQSWTNVCDQSSIQVFVTDVGLGVTCAASHNLNVPDRLRTINFTLTPPTCNNSCNGVATHSPVFGVPPYNFNWTNGETTQNASALCIGMTTLTITDLNNCQFDTTVNIVTPPPIFANININEVTCNDACDGILTSSPIGGTGAPYVFNWTNTSSGSSVSGANSANNLCENITYNLRLIDNSGCFIDTAITMADKIPMTINTASSTDATCFSNCDGQVTLSVTGGIAPYTNFDWYQGTLGSGILQSFSGQSVNQLCPFTNYYVVVTDSDGCSDSLQITQLASPPAINIGETHTDNSCFGDNSGTININTTGGTSSGTYTYFWSTNDGAGLNASIQNQTGLSGGTYQVLVTDDVGCQDSLSITIAEPTSIIANGIPSDITCFNLQDGTIDLTTTGGAGGYTWSWSSTDVNFTDPGTEDLSGLDSGSYSVRIIDVSNCFIDTTINISKPIEIFINGTETPILCNNDNNAQITINPVNGTGTYSFDWDIDGTGDFDDLQNQSGLSPNTYNLSVRDVNGCQKDTAFIIVDPAPLTATNSTTQPNCGQSNGTITVVVSGGTPTYSYSWLNSGGTNVGNLATASGLPAGCYDLTVTDANNCTFTQQICITDTPLPTATLSPVDASCNGVCDGSITINTTGVSAPYTTNWSSTDLGFVDPNTDNIFTLCAADYTVLITDATNCTFTQTVTIAEPPIISVTDVTQQVSCSNGSDGAINITASGGTVSGNYSYSWVGSNSFSNSSEDITGLPNGNYTVTITDDNNCSVNESYSIIDPAPITITTSTVNSQCNNNTGSISATVNGGNPGYSFNWTNSSNTPVGTNSPTLSGQTSGVYNLLVTDNNGCTETTTAAISDDTAPTLTIDNFGDATCNAASDGFINITATGGTGILNYSWTSSPTGFTSNNEDINLLAGNLNYNITITDANGCAANQSVFISEPLPITINSNVTNPLCNGTNSGAIDITVLGGTPSYTFDWDNDGTGDFDDTEDLSNLIAGSYVISVLDNNNCPQSTTINLNDPTSINLTTSSINSNCLQNDGSVSVVATNGTPIPPNTYTYQWSQTGQTSPILGVSSALTNLPAGCYDVLVRDANNCSQLATVCITDNSGADLSIVSSDVTCFGSSDGTIALTITNGQTPYTPITWTGNTNIPNGNLSASNLQSGVYTVQVTDGSGCVSAISDSIKDPLQIAITAITTNPNCNNDANGSINATVVNTSGAVNYSWTGPTGFTDPGTEDLTNISAGQYCLTVTDANNCSNTQCFNLNAPPSLSITSSNIPSDCANNTGQLSSSVTGGNPTYSYNWLNSSNNSVGSTANINNLGPDTYTLTVTDSKGCTATSQETINIANAPSLSLVNANDVLCKGESNGSIVISVTGGTPAYTFNWDNLTGINNPQNQNSLPAGSYSVTVTDASGCTDNLIVAVNEPALVLSANGVATNAACNNESNGAIDLTVTGGTTNYNFLWSNNGTTEDINGLVAGTYSVIVTDNNGCITNDTTEITSPAPLNLTTNSVDAACSVNSGNASVIVTGGNPTYNYSWSNVTNSQPGSSISGNTSTINNLLAGAYQVVITDVNGCTDSSIISVSNTTGPTVNAVITDALCFGGNSGAIDITVTGTPTFSYNWTGPSPFAGSILEDISSVEAGVYSVSVADGNNCITTQVFTINGPTSTIQDNAIVSHLTCYENSTGVIDLTPTGGTSPYTVTWNGPNVINSNSEDINNLSSGNYNLQIVDNNNCSYSNTIVVTEPDSIQITPIATRPTCGVNDGQISVSAVGGTISSDYSYSWLDLSNGNNIGSTNTITSLVAGNYQVTLTDDNGCSNTLIIPLSDNNSPPLTILTTDVDCFGNSTGSIDLTVGGSSTYSFDWDNDGTGDNDDNEDLFTLPVGIYNVIVTDLITGCIANASTTILEPTPLSLSASESDLTCFEDNTGAIDVTVTGGTTPYLFDWDNLTGTNDPEDQSSLTIGTYSVTITDNNGCNIGDVYTLTQPLEINTPAIITDNICFGANQGSIDITPINGVPNYTFSWSGLPPFTGSTNEDLNNLAAGNYSLTTIDNNGCRKDTLITVGEPSPISFNVTTIDASCNTNDGGASVIVTGGTLTSSDYTYNWFNSGSSISTTNTISSINAGSYLLSVIDDNGCQKDSLINVNNTNSPTITFDSLTTVKCPGESNGSVYVSISGGSAPYSQIWNPNGVSLLEDLINVSSGNYTLTVTDNAGCISSFDTTLVEPSAITSNISTTDATCDSCNGTASITTTGGEGTISYLWSNNSTASTLQNMCAGVYPVLISDDNNCSITSNVIVNNSGGPTGETISSSNVSCHGGNDGSISVNALGGVAPYTYFWPHNGSTLNSQSNLTAGTYIVQMKDQNGCLRSTSISVTEPNKVVSTSFVNPSSCGGNDGSISITINGGTAPYSIAWNGGLGGNANISNLSSGIYSTTITDANLCSENFTFNLPDITAPSVSLTVSNVLCNGENNGSINSTVLGNTGAISYQWYNNSSLLSAETNPNLQNLSPNTYSVTILDNATGCQNQASITVSEPDSLILALPTLIDASCNSVCDASALVNPIGGTLGYSYLWSNGETTQTADSLCTGINTVLIIDNNNCSTEQTIISNASNNLTASITNTDALCGQCDGTSVVVPSGGSGNYSLLWADSTTDLTHANLCAGIHPFEIIDTNGCSTQLQSVISNTGGPDNETINISNITCKDGDDGSIEVNPSGGTTPYSYLWIPLGITSNTINGLEAGTYYLEVTDSNKCTRVVPVELTEPEQPLVDAIVTNENCGNSDGTIAITINGPYFPYAINWSGPNGFTSSLSTLSNLEAGVYELNIIDNNGCLTNLNFTVNSKGTPNLTISKTDATCFGLCDGSAQVTASPSGGSYTYTWIGETITTPTINNLCAGNYMVEVRDVNTGCVITQSVEIEEKDSISIEVPFIQNPTCFELCDGIGTVVATGGALAYNYNWLTGSETETQNNLCVGESKVIITDADGCQDSLTINILEPEEIIITIDSTVNSECVYSTEGAIYTTVSGGSPGYDYSWETLPSSGFTETTEDISGLLPTSYVLTVTDNNNCIKIDTVEIDTIHIVIADAGLDASICIGDCATFIGEGEGPSGIVYEWFDLDNNSISNIDSLTQCPDSKKEYTYILEVSDAFCFDRDSVDLTVIDLPEVDAGFDITGLTGSIVVLGGNPTSTSGDIYEWSPLGDIFGGEELLPNPQLELNEEGEYVVTVTDTNGCVNSDTIFVKPIPDVSFPNGFTPNNDGTNDYWRIDFIIEFPQSTVEIYNRWGQLLFRSIGYNDPWDGIYKGKPLPVGTYYYIIELNDPNFPDGYTGPITIMR
jgi:gliding motility-associated-like protein